MEATLDLKSSEGEAYQVFFLRHEEIIYLACTCKAGAFAKLCRHKLAVLRGDSKALQDPDQKELLLQVQSHLAGTEVITLSQELQGLEESLDLLQQKAKALRAAIELQIKNVRPNAKIWKTI